MNKSFIWAMQTMNSKTYHGYILVPNTPTHSSIQGCNSSSAGPNGEVLSCNHYRTNKLICSINLNCNSPREHVQPSITGCLTHRNHITPHNELANQIQTTSTSTTFYSALSGRTKSCWHNHEIQNTCWTLLKSSLHIHDTQQSDMFHTYNKLSFLIGKNSCITY